MAKTSSNAGSIDTPHASFGNAAMASLQDAPAQPPSEAFTEELAAQLLEKYKLWQQQMSSLVASVGRILQRDFTCGLPHGMGRRRSAWTGAQEQGSEECI